MAKGIDWDTPGPSCPRCGRETFRLLGGMCPACYWRWQDQPDAISPAEWLEAIRENLLTVGHPLRLRRGLAHQVEVLNEDTHP